MRFRGGRASASASLNSEDRFVAGNLTNATVFLTRTLSLSLFFLSLSHIPLAICCTFPLRLSLFFCCQHFTVEMQLWGAEGLGRNTDRETKGRKKAEIVVLREAGNPVRFIRRYLMNRVLRKCLRAALTVRCITGSYTEVILLWEMIHDHW